jgi:hypothetical protein
MNKENQLSRYGGIAKKYPLTTGKLFFLVNSSEFAAAELSNKYPADQDGVPRVYTSYAAVISAIQVDTAADVIMVSPLFTTAPTKAQQLQLDAAGVTVVQAGSCLPDGSYLAASSAVSLAATTTQALFAVTGRVEIFNLLGEIVTTVGATGTNAKLTSVPTVGTTTDLCATATTTSLPVGANLTITGTLANAMATTVQSVFTRQATTVVMTAGTLQLTTNATTTGNVKWRLHYKPLDPGAFIAPLA